MYKIGEFSKLAKTTIKTLRYYEKEGLLISKFVDDNGYRYYDTYQLIEFSKIISLRQIGLSIIEIKSLYNGKKIEELLSNRKQLLNKEIESNKIQLSKIEYMMENKNMKYEVIVKKLPEYIIYYKDGIINDFSELTDFILESAKKCLEANPNIVCIKPNYCYVNYLDNEYKENNIKIRYAQAVKTKGIETDSIKFMNLNSVEALCIYHKGSYETLRDAYSFIMKYIEDNSYEIIDYPRECYIDGMWNKDNVMDWLTEIQVPIRKK